MAANTKGTGVVDAEVARAAKEKQDTDKVSVTKKDDVDTKKRFCQRIRQSCQVFRICPRIHRL